MSLSVFCTAQNNGLFPIKKDGKWGVINDKGQIIVQPAYDGISSFKYHNYAVVQKDGKAGLLNEKGRLIFQPIYEDIRVISKNLFGIYKNDAWQIVNNNGTIILKDYDDVELLNENHVIFWKNGYSGLVDIWGSLLIPPNYDRIKWDTKNEVFVVKRNGKTGLYSALGQVICDAIYREVKILHDDFILIKSKYKWGAIDKKGRVHFYEQYSNYKENTHDFIMMYKQENCFLFSIKARNYVNQEPQKNFIPLNEDWIVFQKFQQVGLMKSTGEIVAPASFHEIRTFGEHNFRVSLDEKWGVINSNNELVSPIIYDYISPLKLSSFSIVKKDNKFGILEASGRLVANTIYDEITTKNNQIQAYQDNKLSIFSFTEEGLIPEEEFNEFTSISIKKREKQETKENYLLEHFEWFYSLEKKKWGLRNIQDGSTRISPMYDFIEIKREHGLTIAGIRKSVTEKFGDFPVRFNFHFTLIDNELGTLTSELTYREVRFSDFDAGKPTARVILENGRHGLIDKKGQSVCIGYAFIGNFQNGLAPMAMQGQLGAAKNKNDNVICSMEEYLIGSYGTYIIGDFGNIPKYIPDVSCIDCAWGYIDTLGRMMVPPDYQAASLFRNEAGIVKKDGKWGIVNRFAEEVLPCAYEKIANFNDNSEIIRVASKCDKYGLVDADGALICDAKFDNLRDESDGLMAFESDGQWGFILPNGNFVIKAQFEKVYDFKEGKAAVFNGFKWGFINKLGDLIIDYQYSRVGNFSNGLAWVKTSKGVGYINDDDKVIIPIEFRKAFDFEGDVARVIYKDKTRVINSTGEFVSTNQFDDLSSFDKYGLAVARSNFKNNINYFLVNKKGERIGSHTFRKIYPFSEGLAAVKKKNKYGFINAQGQIIVPAEFDKVSQFSEGLAWVKSFGKCGYINKMGKFVVDPEFSKCKDFEDGIAIVYVNSRKGGLVDKGGDYVLKPRLNKLVAFSEGKGLVKNNRKFHFVRESGEIYEGYFDTAETFKEGTALVEIDGKWGMINEKGVAIISPKYESLERLNNGLYRVKVSRLNGIVQPNGQFILTPSFEYLNYMGHGIIRIEQGGKIGYMNIKGDWIWNLEG